VAIHNDIISRRGKKRFSIRIKSTMKVWRTYYIEMRGCNLKIKEKEGNA